MAYENGAIFRVDHQIDAKLVVLIEKNKFPTLVK